MRDSHVPRERQPFRVDVLPARPTFDQAWRLRLDTAERPMWGMVGVGGDELGAHGVELTAGARAFVIGGPPRSGRSTVLLTMARSFLLGGASLVVAAPRSSPLAELDGAPGVLSVFAVGDVRPDELTAALDRAPGPCVVLMDDAELLRDCAAADVLPTRPALWSRPPPGSGAGRQRRRHLHRFLRLAGGEAPKCRQGALLSPQDPTDGDLIGARLPRSAVGGAVQPGRALVHLGDSHLRTVAVPFVAAGDVRAGRSAPQG